MSLLESLDKSNRSWDQGNKRWWLCNGDDDPSTDLWTTVKKIKDETTWRSQSDELGLRLYSDCKMVGMRGGNSVWEADDILDARMGENHIRSIVRTLHSKTIRHRPRPVVLTEGGSWRLKKRAELLDIWINGKLGQLKADTEIFPMAVLHALILGTGIVRSYGDPENGACLEVIPPYEVFVDDAEACYGSPRSIYLVRVVDRGVLLAKYPEAEEVITNAGSKTIQAEWGDFFKRWDNGRDVDLLITIEAFHLPSGRTTGDGRHVISLDNGILYDEEWKRDHFPLAIIRGERRPLGFWGIGVAEDLAGPQLEHNRTVAARQEMIRLLSVPFWVVERGSKVVKSHISNLIGRIVEYSGTKPELVTPNAVPAELWQHADNIKKGMFEARGVSQLTAQAIKPAGLNSGRALRTYTDLESELLIDLIRSFERLVMDCAELLVEEQEALGKEYSNQAVTKIGRGKIETIRWSQAQLSKDEFRIQVMPASSLSTSVSGRIEDVYDLRDLGAISDPEEIRDLLDLPDLKRQKRRSMAHRELLEMTIEDRILDQGMDITPEPTWDLALAVKLGLQMLMEAETYEDLPPEHLEKLRVFITTCTMMLAPPPPVPDPTMTEPGMEGLPPEGMLDPAMGGLPPPDGALPAPEGALPPEVPPMVPPVPGLA